MTQPPTVTVVVPHYHDLVGLDASLGALRRQTLDDADYEIVVADNRSPEGSEAVERTVAGRARVVYADERGAGMARNEGVRHARGSVLAFTDSDCLPRPEWLAAGLAALEGADAVGGRMVVSLPSVGGRTPRRKSGATAFEQVFAFDNESYVRDKHFSVTANLLTRRTVFEAVGPFRSKVSEDIDWCHRAVEMGYTLDYSGEVVVEHPARADWRSLSAKWRRINEETYALTATDRAGRVRWLVKAAMMPVSVVAHTPRVLTSSELHGAREHLAAWVTLVRIRLWRARHSVQVWRAAR